MKIVSEVRTRKELDELKYIMEIFVVNIGIKELAKDA